MVILIERKGRLMTCVVHKDRHKRKHKISFWLMLSNLEIINTRTTTMNAENTHSSISEQYNTQIGGPVLKLAKNKFAPNAIFRVVTCLCILYDLTCLISLKNSTHSLSYKV